MANTYTQLYFHVVFSVKGRQKLIAKKWKDELYKYITGIITNKHQKLLAINGVEDHIHILIGTKPTCNLSDLVRDIKSNSSKWVNELNLTQKKFQWQSGFGAFTLGHSQLGTIINYIERQEEHHRSKSLNEEYIAFLKSYEVAYKKEYLFSANE